MSEFLKLEANAPPTLGAVVEALTRLSTYPESDLLELISAGKIQNMFPFRPAGPADLGAYSVEEGELVEASAMPLSHGQQAALVHSSLPRSSAETKERAARDRRKTKKPFSD